MRSVILACLVVGITLPTMAQTYDVTTVTGVQPYTGSLRPNAVRIMKGPADNVLSAWQTLPFAWSLYGRPVTGYYASDNGYITFDSSATTSIPTNQPLPIPAPPNLAIFGYWSDLSFAGGQPDWSNEIRTITLGDAPHRFHLIMWVSALPPGGSASTSGLSFGIVLKEEGGFAIVQIAGRGTRNARGTMGVENTDGSKGVLLPGSPSISFPELTASGDDDICIHFSWTDQRYDLALTQVVLPELVRSGTSHAPMLTVKNVGAETVSSCLVHYQVNEGPVHTTPLPAPPLTPGYGTQMLLTPEWVADRPGEWSRFRFWISHLDSGTVIDGNPANDTLAFSVFVNLGVTTKKKVLVEEWTGAWCGWCPDGGLHMNEIERQYPDAVLVSLHAGGTDAMRIATVDSLAEAFHPSYPQAMIDRFLFPGGSKIPISRTSSAWEYRTGQRLFESTPVRVLLTTSWNPGTREVTTEASVRSVDYLMPGDYRLHVFLLEDFVTGSGSGYDQANSYSNNSSYPNHPYYSETNPITGYVHRHVVRQILTDVWGDAGVVPERPIPDQVYTKLYSATLPAGVDPTHVFVVAFVSSHHEDLTRRSVWNAEKVPLGSTSDLAPLSIPATADIQIWPLPLKGAGQISVDLNHPSPARVTVRDLLGRPRMQVWDAPLPSGRTILPFSSSTLESGIYLLCLEASDSFRSRWLVVLP